MAITQVQSVATVHGLQSKRSHGGVALYEMLEAMTRMHEGLNDRRVELEQGQQCANAILLAEANAVAVALILNEVISNAVKHTAAEAGNAPVLVQIKCDPERAQVRVRNRGRLPDGFDHTCGTRVGTGLGLVRTMVPRDGMCMAYAQDGETVDVQIDLTAPVVVSVDGEAMFKGE
jgi:two-component sensor histidine kinase